MGRLCIHDCIPKDCEHRLGKFHQIYKFGTLGDKDELVRFSDEKLKVNFMTRPNVLQKLLFGLFYDHDTVSDDPLNGILYIVGASTFLGKIK